MATERPQVVADRRLGWHFYSLADEICTSPSSANSTRMMSGNNTLKAGIS